MSYYIKRNEINNAQKLMTASINKWSEQLTKVKDAMQPLVRSDVMTGAAADSIRAYISEEPVPIIEAMLTCMQYFRARMAACSNGYGTIDEHEDARISSDRLGSVSESLNLRNDSFYSTREDVFRKLNSVSDIITLGAPSNSVYYDLEGLKKKLNDLQDVMSGYEAAHLHDMDDINDILSALSAALDDAISRTSVQMSTYESGTIPSGEVMTALAQSLLAAAWNTDTDLNKEECLLSADYRSIIYNGESYTITVPDLSGNNPAITGSTWEVVAVIDAHDQRLNWLSAIKSISIGGDTDPKENPAGVDWYKVNDAANLFSSVVDFTDHLLEYSKIFIVLEKDGSGNTRAVIGYSTKALDTYFENFEYGSYNSQYLNAYGDPLRQRLISEGVADAYTKITGEELPAGNYGYSYSWDERHKESEIQAFVFFDEDGNMYKQFLVYGNDKVTMQEYDFMGVPKRDILDVTYYLQEPELMTGEERQLFFNALNKGEK